MFKVRLAITFVCCVIAQLFAGSFIGSFNAYSEALKQQSNLSQREVSLISSVGYFMQNCVFFTGFLVDHYGTGSGFVLGLVSSSVGYMLLWQLTGTDNTSVALFVFTFALIGFGESSAYISSMKAMVMQFARHKGLVIGISTAAFGVSGTLFALVYTQIFGRDDDFLKQDLSNYALFMLITHMVAYTLCVIFVNSRAKPGPEQGKSKRIPLLAALKQWDYWILCILFIPSMSAVVSLVYNIAYITISMHGSGDLSVKLIAYLTALLPAFNGLGRVAIGLTYHHYQDREHAWWVLAQMVLITVVQTILLFGLKQVWTLFVSVILTGLAYGSSYTLVPILVSSWFGAEHFGFNLGILFIGTSFGFVGVQELAGYLYQSNIDEGDDINTCYGEKCWVATFGIFLITLLIACWFALLLAIRRTKSKRRTEMMETAVLNP